MTEAELTQQRREKWRLAGNPARMLEEARAFVESVGFALMYPLPAREQRGRVLAPTFIGAYVGDESNLPTWKHAFADPRAREATDLMVRLLREKSAFELKFGETSFLVSAQTFPFFYGMAGDHNPRQQPVPGKKSEYSPLARDVFEQIREKGQLTKSKLVGLLGGAPSPAALDRALGELWSRLRITRVDYTPNEGAAWDALYRWAPQPVREGINLSLPESLSALVFQYLNTTIAAEQSDLEDFFSYFVPRTRVREAVNALLAAREVSYTIVSGKSMLHVTPRKQAYDPTRNRPIVKGRPRMKKGYGPRAPGYGPGSTGQGTRDTGRGTRDKGYGPRDKGQGRRDSGNGPRDAGQGTRDKGHGARDKGHGARDKGPSK
ncbi:MAG: hypothetical protein ACRD3E_13125 [Terriglobales bacterium]